MNPPATGLGFFPAAGAAPGDSDRLERRAAAEVRASGRRLVGRVARYGVEARLGRVRERIAPGAFAASLASRDILALFNHDPGRVLGRTRSGTLRLAADAEGLSFELDLPSGPTGDEVLSLASRGDLGGMSFGFTVPPGGEAWEGEVRTLLSVELHEVSVVSAWPAYPGTSADLRSATAEARELERRRRALSLLLGDDL